jgi:hypothetical protein
MDTSSAATILVLEGGTNAFASAEPSMTVR